jgi:hypothetical protein
MVDIVHVDNAANGVAETDIRAKLNETIDAVNAGAGDVVGPASATDNHAVAFDGATGKLIKDGGVLGTAAALASTTSTTLAGNSDANLPTEKAVKTYVDTVVTGLLDFKGSTDCSANPNYPAASKGDSYVVSVAGKIGGASGTSVDVGDVYVASADNAGGTQAAVGTSWFALEHNLAGALLSANNLSDLASAATARTNLGLDIGVDVQAYDADLTTWAGVTPGANVTAFLATPSSANLAAALTDETGTGAAVFGTAPAFTTNITSPLVIGGAAASSTLTLESTSAAGTSDAISFLTGSQVERLRISTGGDFTFTLPTTMALNLNGNKTSIHNALILSNIATTGITLGSGMVYKTYDGAAVTQVGAVLATASTWAFGTYSARQLSFSSIGTGGVRFASQSSAPITFHTGNADADFSPEQARIDSSGNFLITGAGGLGYGTGSGGTVTQATSRTAGVTLNKASGAITLVSAAGTATWQSFTVTNSTVGANDTVAVSQKSGADKNMIFVTAVAAGSFVITFATTGDTTTEQPVFNFNVTKGAAS